MKKISKTEAKKKIEDFFKDIKNKSSKEIKKIKKLAMSKKVPLKEKRKLFCKKCFSVYKNPEIRIRNKIKSVKCKNCNYISRWKI
jgi:RNase P subunit RPR2